MLLFKVGLQVKTAEDVLRSQLSVRQTETLVKRLLSDNSKRDQGSDQKDPDVSRLEASLRVPRIIATNFCARPSRSLELTKV